MRIDQLSFSNIRSYKGKHSIGLRSPISLFVGENNSGKSTILRLLYRVLQKEVNVESALEDMQSAESDQSHIEIILGGCKPEFFDHSADTIEKGAATSIQYAYQEGELSIVSSGEPGSNEREDIGNGTLMRNEIRNNLIYPVFSGRMTGDFGGQIGEDQTRHITADLANLTSLVDHIVNPGRDSYEAYQNACTDILNCVISARQMEKGKTPALTLPDDSIVSLRSMGDGSSHVIGLLVYLILAEDQVIMLEDVENGLHPTTIRKLARLIRDAAENNQFLITTHSNVLLRELGGLDKTDIYETTVEFENEWPRSEVHQIGESKSDRLDVLKNLGYEFTDVFMWEGFLVLEEASAEAIIRKILIPEFVPKLIGRLRTIAANGASDVPPQFRDLYRLFVYLHLTPTYENRAWVLVDGDDEGKRHVENLREDFSSWPEEHFRTFEADNFEEYYPSRFDDEVDEVLARTEEGGGGVLVSTEKRTI